MDQFGLTDASFEVCPYSAVEGPVPRPEACITGFEECLDFLRHPGLLVMVDLDTFTYGDSINAAGNVEQNSLCIYCQVIIFKNIPVCLFEAVM